MSYTPPPPPPVKFYPTKAAAVAALTGKDASHVYVAADEGHGGTPRLYFWTGSQFYDIVAGVLETLVPPLAPVISAVNVSTLIRVTFNVVGSLSSRSLSRSPQFTGGAKTLTAAALSYDDAAVTPGTAYTYTLTDSNAGGAGPASSATAAVTALYPAPVTVVPSGAATPGQIAVSWAVAAGTTSQSLTRTPAFAAPVTLTAGQTTYLDTAVNPVTSYSYSLTQSNAQGASAPGVLSIVSAAVAAPPVQLSNTPVWSNVLQPYRLVVNVTNDSNVPVSDQLITVALPSGFTPTNTDLRVLEYGARGVIDRGNERRYNNIDYNRHAFGLPAFVDPGFVTFKELGRHDVGETRTFTFMYGNSAAVAKNYAHLALVNTTATEYQLGRTGPDIDQLTPTTISLPLAGTTYGQGRVVFGTGATILRLLTYNVSGDGATYGLTAGTAAVTQRHCELGILGTLTGQIRTGQTVPDWTGTYTAKYQHRAVGSVRNDTGLPALKGYDILRVSLVLTCGVSFAPANNGVMKLAELYNGNNNATNGAIGMFLRPDGGALIAAPATTAVPFASNVNAGIVGGTGSVLSSGLRVRALSLVNWGAALPASYSWGPFGAQTVGISTAPLSSTKPIPVNAEIHLDFDLVINSTNVVQVNALAPELAEVLDSLGVTL